MGWDGMPASRDRTGPRGRRPEDIRVVAMVSSRTYGFLLDALSRHITAATVSVSPIQASRALSGLPIEASVLVIEPEYLAEASAREKIALPLLVDSINCAFAARTLLLCGCTANSLRTLHGLAGLRRSELFVLEVDGAQLLSSLIVNSNPSAASGDPHGVLGSLEALPPTIREILMSAATAPEPLSVKRVCADGGVSRRTLERICEATQLPPPGRLIRLLRASSPGRLATRKRV